jgi:hypothetical protein
VTPGTRVRRTDSNEHGVPIKAVGVVARECPGYPCVAVDWESGPEAGRQSTIGLCQIELDAPPGPPVCSRCGVPNEWQSGPFVCWACANGYNP